MADISDINSAQSVKIIGSSADGTETYPHNVTILGESYTKQSPAPLQDVVYKSINLRLNGTGTKNMAVNGSSTPQIFSFVPEAGETWFVESLTLLIQDSGSPDPDEFGGRGGLFGGGVSDSNGLVLEARSKGSVYEICNLGDNADITTRFISSYSQGSGSSWLNNNDTWLGTMKFDTPIRLNDSNLDFIRFRVRDNLSSIDYLQVSVKVWRFI